MTESVHHTGYHLDLDLTLDDLGHPELPGLWAEVYRQKHFQRGLLLCNEVVGGIVCREPMYVRVQDGRRVGVHHNPSIAPHPQRRVSPRRALTERILREAERAGFAAESEDRVAGTSTDVLVRGAGGRRVGWTVQLGSVKARTVVQRSRRAHDQGVTPLWTVTDARSQAIDRAPWSRLDAVADWRHIAGTQLNVRGGVRELRMERCDDRRPVRCPDGNESHCGKWHAVWDLALGVYLEDLIAGTARGEYVPLFEPSKLGPGGRHMWVSANDKETALQGRPEPDPWAGDELDVRYTDSVRDDGARIDTADWLTATAAEGPGGLAVVGQYLPPQELVDLRNEFVDLEVGCAQLAARLPSGAAIVAGAEPDADVVERLRNLRAERLSVSLRMGRHPWWAGVDNRYAADRELRKIARDRHQA